VTNELTIFGQTALERYQLSPPTPSNYTGFDYSDLGLRQKLWSSGEWVFSGEATLFLPGAYNSASPAQAGDTGGAAEARLLAGSNFALWSINGFLDAEVGYRLRSAGPPDEWHGDFTVGLKPWPRVMVMLQDFTTISTRSTNVSFPAWRQSVVEASVVFALDDHWSIQIGCFKTVLAIKTNTERGVVAAVWRNF
jgi:protein XagA